MAIGSVCGAKQDRAPFPPYGRRQAARRSAPWTARKRCLPDARSPEIVDLQVEARLRTSIAAFDVLTPPNPDYRDVVCAIDVPTLLVIGDSSPVVTPEMARELQRLNPRFRVRQIEDAGHGLPFDRPDRLAAVVASFLRMLPATSEPRRLPTPPLF